MNRDDLPPTPESCIAKAGLIGGVGCVTLCCVFYVLPFFCYVSGALFW
jgi:hypothetical protein